MSSDSGPGSPTMSFVSTSLPTDSTFEDSYTALGLLHAPVETETPARLLQKFVRGMKISDLSEKYDRTDLDHEIFPIHDLRYHVPIKVLLSTSEGSTRSISPRHVAREPVEKAIFAATERRVTFEVT